MAEERIIAVLGTSPAIITEFAWWLSTIKRKQIAGVEIWTTRVPGTKNEPHGRKFLLEQQNWRNLREHLRRNGRHLPAEKPHFHIFKADNQYIDDIRNEDDSRAITKQLCDAVIKLHEKPETVLHACISGGRKTMSSTLQLAMQLFGEKDDRVYHVLMHPFIESAPTSGQYKFPDKPFPAGEHTDRFGVRWQEKEEIPPEKQLSVAEQQVPLLRPLIPEAARRGFTERLVQELNLEVESLAQAMKPLDKDITGNSPAVQEIRRMVRLVAPGDSTVLLTGETGTGKDVVAQMIHANSPRRERKLIKADCAQASGDPNMAASYLFGHEKGAFTGATTRKKGKFEEADGQTLFLDEVGELPPEFQARLLQALQTKTIERVGGEKPIAVDVRLIAATNRDLEAMIKAGKFREDLYYRLNVIELLLPPLRERREDIPELIDHFIEKCKERSLGPHVEGISPDALSALCAHDWEGNIRALEHAVERAMNLVGKNKQLQPEHFSSTLEKKSQKRRGDSTAVSHEENTTSTKNAAGPFEALLLSLRQAAEQEKRAIGPKYPDGFDRTATVRGGIGQESLTSDLAKKKLKRLFKAYPHSTEEIGELSQDDPVYILWNWCQSKDNSRKKKKK